MWVGDIIKKHIETNTIDSVLFKIYRDDGLDILCKGTQDEQAFKEHMNALHGNIEWDINVASEGGYLDLWLMIKDGEIQWKTYTKTPPLFLHRSSCHDPLVFKGIPKGVGHRLRLTNSTKESFKESVEEYSRSMATSGYKYKHVKNELMKYENMDVKQLVNTQRKETCRTPGAKLFWIFPYDPRVPHPRKIISKNYKYIENHPVASKIFPRKNLVAGSKRLPNLGEILAPTVQTGPNKPEEGGDNGQDGGGGGHPGGGCPAGGRTRGRTRGRRPEQDKGDSGEEGQHAPSHNAENGSYHCSYHKKSGKCDVCSHMTETKSVVSRHFKVKHTISGHNVHPPATQKTKLKWFVYLEEDTLCGKQYVGSTNSITHRWANTKLQCKNRNSKGTGLEEHYRVGCPSDPGAELSQISITLLEHMEVSHEDILKYMHKNSPGCQCDLCKKLKEKEDKWICRMGTLHQPHGLNSRDEIKRKSRCTH